MAKSKLTAANLAGSNSSRGREENDYYATPPHCNRGNFKRN